MCAGVCAQLYETLLRVPDRAGPVVLLASAGTYSAVTASLGFTAGHTACCMDCLVWHGIQAPAGYCSGGLGADYDAVLFLQRVPQQPGIEGLGGSCGSDQYGRSLALFYQVARSTRTEHTVHARRSWL